MTPPTLRAIKCSERMPTREDANELGEVLLLYETGATVVSAWNRAASRATHFFPLNRSAIATDAEEQT